MNPESSQPLSTGLIIHPGLLLSLNQAPVGRLSKSLINALRYRLRRRGSHFAAPSPGQPPHKLIPAKKSFSTNI